MYVISTFLLAPKQFPFLKNQALDSRSSITLLKDHNSQTYLGIFINDTEDWK